MLLKGNRVSESGIPLQVLLISGVTVDLAPETTGDEVVVETSSVVL